MILQRWRWFCWPVVGWLALEALFWILAARVEVVGAGSAASGTRPVALCIGDGLCCGLGGERSSAYPARVAAAMRSSSEGRWRIVDRGLVGQDSRELALALPELLDAFQPDLVYVTVGAVDVGSQPPPVPVAVGSPRFGMAVWELLRQSFGSGEVVTGLAFVGDWHIGGVHLHFGADRSFGFADIRGHWTGEASPITVTLADGGVLPVEWQLAGDQLVISGDFPGRRLTLSPGRPLGGALPRAAARFAIEDLFEARRLWSTLAAGPVSPTPAHLGLLAIAELEGEASRVDAQLAWFRQRAETAGEAGRRDLVRARLRIGDLDPADLAAALAGWRDDPAIWLEAAKWMRRGAVADLLRRQAPDPNTVAAPAQAGWWRVRGGLVSYLDPLESARCELRAVAVDGDLQGAVTALLRRPGLDLESLRHAADDLGERFAQKSVIAAVVAEFERQTAATASVLRHNLGQIVAACRARGAEPVLMTYPAGPSWVDAAIRAEAVSIGVSCLDLAVGFAAPRGERWLRRDGYCTAAGYQRIAARVTADLRARSTP